MKLRLLEKILSGIGLPFTLKISRFSGNPGCDFSKREAEISDSLKFVLSGGFAPLLPRQKRKDE